MSLLVLGRDTCPLLFTLQLSTKYKYEYLNTTVTFSSPRLLNGNIFVPVGQPIVQIISILDINDSPTIKNPSESYIPPLECSNAASENFFCNFGQFWTLEDSGNVLPITGTLIDDLDLYEPCVTSDPECSNLDVYIKTYKGAIQLNTRSNLNFYVSARSQSGFTATIKDLTNAVKVLYYRVDTLDLINTPLSATLNYNTQRSISNEVEYITIKVSDQGFSGADGMAKETVSTVNVVIVAANDAPTIYMGVTEYAALEDVLTQFPPDVNKLPISFADVDIDEKISSPVALKNWIGKSGSDVQLNKILLKAQLQHGAIKFGYVRNLQILATAAKEYSTVGWSRFGHDLCRVSNLITDSKALQKVTGYASPSYTDVCIFSNLGTFSCPTGQEKLCSCQLEGDCREGTIVLFLNRTSTTPAQRQTYGEALRAAFKTQDLSCGGMPVFPAPNNFTHGLRCDASDKCSDVALPKCVPGVTCRCCMNLSHTCATVGDCERFDVGSQCGCVPGGGGIAVGGGTCGPFYASPAMSGAPWGTNLVRIGHEFAGVLPRVYGHDCVYAGAGSDLCRAAAFAVKGTALPVHVATVSLESLGSGYVELVGLMVDVNRALKDMYYITNPQYNRLYRPPVEERDLLTFDIEADALERLDIEANDLGNSGGGPYDPKTATKSVFMRIAAVNDPPMAQAPASVLAYEDLPLHFLPPSLPPGATSNYEVYSVNPLHAEGISVYDPDYQDYGFSSKIMSINISCLHGRLFLNEPFLQLPGVAGDRIKFIHWAGETQLRGLNSVKVTGGGQPVLDSNGKMQSLPKYGNGCQFKPSCADDASGSTPDSPYGFFSTPWYGLVYSPQLQSSKLGSTSVNMGCGICEENVGDKFISLVGTYQDLNLALARVTYLPDPNFNTRYGVSEQILFQVKIIAKIRPFSLLSPPPASPLSGPPSTAHRARVLTPGISDQVSDDGAIGNDVNAPSLSAQRAIEVVVESINDRPLIGRRVRSSREINSFDGVTAARVVEDWALRAISKADDVECFAALPSSAFYASKCAASWRQYIDIDEDTVFMVSPDVLWLNDVDSREAEIMDNPSRRRYCCLLAGPIGCRCGQPCLCGTRPCACSIPDVCNGGAGQLLVNLEVKNGLLSFYPPPGRALFSSDQVTFLTNETEVDMLAGGATMPCPDQLRCMVNVTRLQIRTSLGNLQTAIEQYFLTYTGKPNYSGPDSLRIWVSDRGMTDECYNSTLIATETLNIRVVAVNDPPVVLPPNRVSQYPKGQRCYSNFMLFSVTSPEGVNSDCTLRFDGLRDTSAVPPAQLLQGVWVNSAQFIRYTDIDINDSPPKAPQQPLFTLTLTVGNNGERHGAAGSFFIPQTLAHGRVWLEQFRQDGLVVLQLEGVIDDINVLLRRLKYDADPSYQGYVPFVLFASDNRWYGECSGNHACGKDQPCINGRTATSHVPPQIGTLRTIVDVTVQAPERCKSTACAACNAEAGCGWCPTACAELGGKCMVSKADGSAPKFETCAGGLVMLNGTLEYLGWRRCNPQVVNILVPVGAGLGALAGLAIFGYFYKLWIRRRHGSVRVYVVKKKNDFARALFKLHLMPPPEADYWKVFCTIICLAIVAVVASILGAQKVSPSCVFREQFSLDKAATITLSFDNCNLRFLPTRTQLSPDNELEAVKIKFAIKSDPSINLISDVCGQDVKFTVNNSLPSSVKYLGYFCNVEILVPDRFVMPAMTIIAIGDNVTTVRAGPMDLDTPDFGLDFGPNAFVLSGKRMSARLQNVSAKSFTYDVLHGGLTAVALRTTDYGEFNSLDGDMVVTTPVRTSIKFWQKSGNKACLTAAPGSLYVDNACNNVCVLKAANSTNGTRRDFDYPGTFGGLSGGKGPPGDSDLPAPPRWRADISPWGKWGVDLATDVAKILPDPPRRQLGAKTVTLQGLVITDPVASDPRSPWICTGEPNVDQEWSCSR